VSVEIKGMDALLKELERKLGKANIQRVTDRALVKAADVFVKELKRQFQSFKDTGASIDEITLSSVRTVNGARTITVYWEGPRSRYRIIHLNEWGTVKHPSPRGKGRVAAALKNSEKAYRDVLIAELKRGI